MINQFIVAGVKAADNVDDFEDWLSQRHKWLQTAAHRMIESKAVATEAVLEELTRLCIGEASETGTHAFTKVAPGSLVHGAVRPTLHIEKLSDVRGVNKIRDNASLNFGTKNLVVVFGTNGSGKTGFSRLLKQVCGSPAREEIYPNVFDKAATSCEARISVAIGGTASDLPWTLKGGPLAPLRDVHVFDSKTATNYVMLQNEARYEPSRMRFVSALIKTSDEVSTRLSTKKNLLLKKLPLFPHELSQAPNVKWFSSLHATTGQVAIDSACDYSKEFDEERIKAEGALAQKDIVGRLLVIGREQTSLAQIKITLSVLQDGYSDEKLSVLIAARGDALAKRKLASEAAHMFFATAPLEGVGQETWLALWERAREFSKLHAYPDHAFPNIDDGAHCVLCQQTLDDDAKTRVGHFEAFVIGGLEDAAKAAEKMCANLLYKLPILPHENDWKLQAGILKLGEKETVALFSELGTRYAAALIAKQMKEIPVANWSAIDKAHLDVTEALNTETKALKELQSDGMRKQLEARVLELLAIQWLSQNKVAIVEEVERLKTIALIDKAIGLTNTNILTRKHTDLAKDDLHKNYQNRFAKELQLLGGKRLPVKPESKQAGKGRMKFGLQIQGMERALAAELVLSEGETRVVALAAFLADITGLEHRSPFIFDDPISSLDQDFEEKVVKRLVELSKTRQVIVFTHRLSLLALLENEVKKLKEDADLTKIPPAVELHIQSVCSFGKHAGIVRDIGIRDLKPKSAINRMRLEQIPQLQKLIDAGDVMGYNERANGLCGDLRILVERCVENVLLNDVLIRFRRGLQTQGRIGSLAKITSEDCAFIDDLMTRYSVFEHSQSDELPAALPDFSEIAADVSKLTNWIEEFTKRAVTAPVLVDDCC